MKKLVLLIFSLFAFYFSKAQIINNVTQTFRNGIWVADHYLGVDSAMLFNAVDTNLKPLYPALGYFNKDSSFYFWNLIKWKKIGSGLISGTAGYLTQFSTDTSLGNSPLINYNNKGVLYSKFNNANSTIYKDSGWRALEIGQQAVDSGVGVNISSEDGASLASDTSAAGRRAHWGSVICGPGYYNRETISGVGLRNQNGDATQAMEFECGYDTSDVNWGALGSPLVRYISYPSPQVQFWHPATFMDNAIFQGQFNCNIPTAYFSTNISLGGQMMFNGGMVPHIRTITTNDNLNGTDYILVYNSSIATAITLTIQTSAIGNANHIYCIVNRDHTAGGTITMTQGYYDFSGNLVTSIPISSGIWIYTDGTNFYQLP